MRNTSDGDKLQEILKDFKTNLLKRGVNSDNETNQNMQVALDNYNRATLLSDANKSKHTGYIPCVSHQIKDWNSNIKQKLLSILHWHILQKYKAVCSVLPIVSYKRNF